MAKLTTADVYGILTSHANVIAKGDVTVLGKLIINSTTPASSSASGIAGQIAYDDSFIYVCIAANTWKKVAIATW